MDWFARRREATKAKVDPQSAGARDSARRPSDIAICESGPYRLRPPMSGDVTAVAAYLRQSDLLDIGATTRLSPVEALARAVASSHRAFAIDYRDRCVCLGGTTHFPHLERTSIWLLGSEGFDQGLRAGGWRLCKTWFDIFAAEPSVYFAVLPEANRRDVRWLGWLGFKVEARLDDYRGLGHTCLRMVCDRRADQTGKPAELRIVRSESELSSAPQRSALDPDYAVLGPPQADSPFEQDRFVGGTGTFDAAIADAAGRTWNPRDARYLDGSLSFDVTQRPLVSDDLVVALRSPLLLAALEDERKRTAFVNSRIRRLISTLLYGEQCAQSSAAILSATLRDSSAREYAASRALDNMRQVRALSRYLSLRWNGPTNCPAGLKAVLMELVHTADLPKKIVGVQVLVDGLLLNAYEALHSAINDPLARAMVEFLSVAKLQHHEVGLTWLETMLPRLSVKDHSALAEWTGRCFFAMAMQILAPAEERADYVAAGVDFDLAREDLQAVLVRDRRPTGGLDRIFANMAATLRRSSLVTEQAMEFYSAFGQPDVEGLAALRALAAAGRARMESARQG